MNVNACPVKFSKSKNAWATLLLSTIGVLTLASCGFEVVDTGRRGVKTTYGEVIGEPLPEGLHFYNPFTSGIYEYSVREDKFADSTYVFTKDTQKVSVEFAVMFAADPKFVHTLYREIGPLSTLVEKIIKPTVLGSLKDAIGQVIADELVSKREFVTKAALDEVRDNLRERHVLVTDLQFTNLDFDDGYEHAVEQKVIAIQQAQKAVNETVTIKEQAKQTILAAEAEAKSMQIKSEALSKNKGLVEFEAVQKWDGKLPVYVLGNQPMPFIDMQKLGK